LDNLQVLAQFASSTPTCPVNQTLVNGACVPIPPVCSATQTLVNGSCVSPVATTTRTDTFSAPTANTAVTAGQAFNVTWQGSGFSTYETGNLYLYTSAGTQVSNPYQFYANTSHQNGWNLYMAGGSFNPALRGDLPAGTYQLIMKNASGNPIGQTPLFQVTGAITATSTTARNSSSLNQVAGVLQAIQDMINALR
jgi:hypothetical protein